MRRAGLHTGLLGVALAAGACGGESPVAPAEPSGVPAAAPPASAVPSLLPSCTPVVESFLVVEYLYPGYPGWNYAPKARVACPAGTAGVRVARVEVAIPGFLPAPPACSGLEVGGGQSLDLFGEVYGDYEFSIVNGGARATEGEAAVTVFFDDHTGVTAALAARGPVVPGGLPTTFSGGIGSWGPCR